MNRLLFSLFLLLINSALFAQIKPSSANIVFRVEESDWDETVDTNCARIVATVQYEDTGSPAPGATITLMGSDQAIYTVPPTGVVEILTDKEYLGATISPYPSKSSRPYYKGAFTNLKIENGKAYRIYIGLTRPDDVVPFDPPPAVRKPVLYFYPEKEMALDIQLKPHGQFTFTYPKYEDGWSAQISPNGNIQIDGKNYPYLFWEGQLKSIAQQVRQSGFVVEAEETVTFLEEKLELLGLNEREMTDFITFWAPQLEQNHYNFVHFVTGEDYEEQIAAMQLSQEPDSKIRIHLWFAALESPIQVEEQELVESKRKGFTVVEWGGGSFDWMAP
jgi:hypothetical protein